MQLVRRQQPFFLACGRSANIDGRVDALLGDLALEVQLHVARALELLVDHLVHLGSGVDQRRRDNGQAAAFLDVSRRAEETLRPFQGMRIDAAGQHLPGGRDDGVVGARQPRDGVEQDNHVLLVFHQALGLFDHHFGHLDVARWRFVEGARHDLCVDHRALHVGDFFRTLVDQQNDDDGFRIVRADGLGDVLQDDGLARLGRRDDEATLTLSEGRDQVDDACDQVRGTAVAAFEHEALFGEQRGEVFEQDLVLPGVRLAHVDLVNLEQCEVLAILRRADLARDAVARAQAETPYLARRDVDVVRSGKVGAVRRPQEAESILKDFEHPFAVDVFAVLGHPPQNCGNDLLFAQTREIVETDFPGHIDQFGDGFGFQVSKIHGAGSFGGSVAVSLTAHCWQGLKAIRRSFGKDRRIAEQGQYTTVTGGV